MTAKSQALKVECRKATVILRWDRRCATLCYRLFHTRLEFPQPPGPNPLPRAGMSLIELLVVIVILTTIVAAAIPLLSPANDDRRLREAARGVNTFINGAQSRAIGGGHPVGLAIKRLAQDTNKAADRGVCVELFYVEQPAPYTGFDANSRAAVALNPQAPGLVLIRFITRGTTTPGLPIGWTVDLFPSGVIHQGDLIEINGTQYELLLPANSDLTINPLTGAFEQANSSRVAMIVARPRNDSGQQINPRYDSAGLTVPSTPAVPPYWTDAAPYKVLRRPVQTSDEPYQLPEGTVIDLRASGVGSQNYFYVPGLNDNDQGILIMFAPEGRVARVAYYQTPNSSTPFDGPVVDNIYLLVGRRDKAPPPDVGSDGTLNIPEWSAAVTDDQKNRLREPVNWLSGTSRWVVIGPQSGRIATIENGFVDPLAVMNGPPSPFLTAMQSTEEMRCAQILSAREFTREMGQLGGR